MIRAMSVFVGVALWAACGEPGDPVQSVPVSPAATSAAPRPEDPAQAPTAGSQRSAADAGALVFTEHRVTDPGMNNTVISTLLVPEGWSVEGGASRPSNQLWNMPVVIDVWIKAPDGRMVRFQPSLAFEFNRQAPGQLMQPNGNGNLYYPLPESPGKWMLEVIKANPAPGVSKVRLVSEEDLPGITQALRQRNAQRFQSIAQLNQTTASMGFGSQFDTQATQVVMRYDLDGKAIEMTTVLTWQYEVMVRQGQVTGGTWNILFMQSLGGPVGTKYVDDPALNAIVQSVRNNPAWIAEMDTYWAEIARIRHKGVMDSIQTAANISRIQAEGAAAVNDIMMKGWRAESASSDRLQARTVDTILEQTPYQTPAGESIQLPSFYDHVYTDGNGRFLLHNDALYEPNLDPSLNGNWERIEAQR